MARRKSDGSLTPTEESVLLVAYEKSFNEPPTFSGDEIVDRLDLTRGGIYKAIGSLLSVGYVDEVAEIIDPTSQRLTKKRAITAEGRQYLHEKGLVNQIEPDCNNCLSTWGNNNPMLEQIVAFCPRELAADVECPLLDLLQRLHPENNES